MNLLLLIAAVWVYNTYGPETLIENRRASDGVVISVASLWELPPRTLPPPPSLLPPATCPAHYMSYESYSGRVAYDSRMERGMR